MHRHCRTIKPENWEFPYTVYAPLRCSRPHIIVVFVVKIYSTVIECDKIFINTFVFIQPWSSSASCITWNGTHVARGIMYLLYMKHISSLQTIFFCLPIAMKKKCSPLASGHLRANTEFINAEDVRHVEKMRLRLCGKVQIHTFMH